MIGCAFISVVLTLVTFVFIKLTSGLTLSIVNIVKQLVRWGCWCVCHVVPHSIATTWLA